LSFSWLYWLLVVTPRQHEGFRTEEIVVADLPVYRSENGRWVRTNAYDKGRRAAEELLDRTEDLRDTVSDSILTAMLEDVEQKLSDACARMDYIQTRGSTSMPDKVRPL
jgi:hypothetical protein